MVADQVAHPAHLAERDTSLAFVSRAPQAEIARLTERMGWEPIPLTNELPFLTICGYEASCFHEGAPDLWPDVCAKHWALSHAGYV
jgi:hypothetical protein